MISTLHYREVCTVGIVVTHTGWSYCPSRRKWVLHSSMASTFALSLSHTEVCMDHITPLSLYRASVSIPFHIYGCIMWSGLVLTFHMHTLFSSPRDVVLPLMPLANFEAMKALTLLRGSNYLMWGSTEKNFYPQQAKQGTFLISCEQWTHRDTSGMPEQNVPI